MKTGYIIFKNRDSRRADSVLIINGIVKFGYRRREGCWLCLGNIAYASTRGPLRKNFSEWKKYNITAEEVIRRGGELKEVVDNFLEQVIGFDDSFIGIFADKREAFVLEVVKGNYKIEGARRSAVRTNHFLLLDMLNEFEGLDESRRRLELVKELLKEKDVREVLQTPGVLRENTVATAVVEDKENEINVFSIFRGKRPRVIRASIIQ